MHKSPWRATALMSVFFVFFLSLRSRLDKPENEGTIGTASSTSSLHRYEHEALNKSAYIQIVPSHQLENPHSSHDETKNEPNQQQNDSQPRVSIREQHIPHIIHSDQETIVETKMDTSVLQTDKSISQASLNIPPSSSTTISSGNIDNPLQKSHWRRNSWGSHPLPSRSEFTPRAGAHWVTFFHEQAVAAVLLTDNATILDCIVQEVIETWEQRKALEYLGEIMPLQPVELPFMVHLSTMCGVLNTPQPASRPADTNPINLWSQSFSVLQGILPGTLWCGRSDQAVVYRHLGVRTALDSCCRTHDHCPIKLLPMTTRYGLTNLSLKTRSHCFCDLEFYRCLKALSQSDALAKTVGDVYFNFLKMDCLSNGTTNAIRGADSPTRYTFPSKDSLTEQTYSQKSTAPTLQHRSPNMNCSRQDANGRCRMWLLNPLGSAKRFYFTPFNLTF